MKYFMPTTERNKYFEYRKQRAIEKANYQAQADVSEARRDGEIAVETNRRDTRIKKAQLEQEAKLAENENLKTIEVSNAQLEVIRSENFEKSEIARIEAEMAAKEKQAILQRDVNTKLKVCSFLHDLFCNYICPIGTTN